MIFVRIEVVYGVFCSVERLDLRHSELCRKGEVQHPDGEWGFGLLYRGVHGDWSSAFYRYLHVADFLLDVPEPLLPRPLLVAILFGGLVRIMLPGVVSFPFSIRFSTRVEVLFSSSKRVLGLSLTRLWKVNCPRRLAGLASLEDWRRSCLCSELIPSVPERSALFVKELSFPHTTSN